MPSLPPPSTLPHSPDETLISVLDLLFEPSPALHALTLPILRSTTFPSYPVLITAISAQLTALASSSSPEDITKLSGILSSHPRLGEKKVDSELSRSEQKQLQSGDGEELGKLNREYEERFGGLRYVYVSVLFSDLY
jgi:2-oxo-4-hydroxy-4-carboxy--5-ureidoimidazoline (OHCU) decarboxylase